MPSTLVNFDSTSTNKIAATAPQFIPYQVCRAIVASSRPHPHPPVSKMTWSKVAESRGTKWICIASTKACIETVNRPNTVLEMLPGTEVTLLSESQVGFNIYHIR